MRMKIEKLCCMISCNYPSINPLFTPSIFCALLIKYVNSFEMPTRFWLLDKKCHQEYIIIERFQILKRNCRFDHSRTYLGLRAKKIVLVIIRIVFSLPQIKQQVIPIYKTRSNQISLATQFHDIYPLHHPNQCRHTSCNSQYRMEYNAST